MARVQLIDVNKAFGDVVVIPSIDLDIADREFVVLVGPSGCGKTTTLRMVAGLEAASGGTIRIGEREVTDLRPGLRNCAMVFQNYALYPHMSVAQNISYGMKVRGEDRGEIERKVDNAARILGLEDFLHRRPKHLSGGQRQRVAIGRAIVRDPDVFLFDEPLSNLDAKLRIEMRTEIKTLHRRLENTVIYVTHDQVEAMTLANRVVVMNEGRIEQYGRPIEVYERPANTFVASFIGAPSMNFLPGRVVAHGSGLGVALSADAVLPVPGGDEARYRGHLDREVTFGLRPEHFVPEGEVVGTLPVTPLTTEPLGPHTLLFGDFGEARVVAQIGAHEPVDLDRPYDLSCDMQKMHLFDRASGVAL